MPNEAHLQESSYAKARKELAEFNPPEPGKKKKGREYVKPVRQAGGVRFGYWKEYR